VVAAAKRTIDERGFGLSSVRFICGTQDIHTELEDAIAAFHGKEQRSSLTFPLRRREEATACQSEGAQYSFDWNGTVDSTASPLVL
jgi:hypothetical protein